MCVLPHEGQMMLESSKFIVDSVAGEPRRV
jgi:hypothetical protein